MKYVSFALQNTQNNYLWNSVVKNANITTFDVAPRQVKLFYTLTNRESTKCVYFALQNE